MSNDEIAYDTDQLKQAGDGTVAAHRDVQAQLQACQSQIDGLGQWWNPDNDPNDLIGGILGGCFTGLQNAMMSTGQQNNDVLHGHGTAMQETAANMNETENANVDLSGSALEGGA